MKKIKSFVTKISRFLPALALVIGILSTNSACYSLYYQPEVPSGLDKYRS